MGHLPPIDLLLPECFAADGGIQRYSRTLIRALLQIRPLHSLRVFIRNDCPHHLPGKGWEGVHWFPSSGSRRRLAIDLFRAAKHQKPLLLWSTHPHFAPLQILHQSLSGSPSWCSAHGIEVWDLAPGPRHWALPRLHRLLPVSRFTAERLRLQLGRRCPPLGVLPNTVDGQRFNPGPRPQQLLQRYGLSPEQPLIMSCSRLSRTDAYKNIDQLIEALPALATQWPDLMLLIAGTGDDRHRLEQLAQARGVAAHVIFTGRVHDSELADHYRLASVFALPSTGEGFGIVFLEALACGRPVLAGNRDGSVDPLADGRFSLLVDPHLPLAPPLASLLAHQGEDLWFQPEALAAQVGEAFGFKAFCNALETAMSSLEQA